MYKYTTTGVIRVSDGFNIPADLNSQDYIDFVSWVQAGNIPEPINCVLTPTIQQQQAMLETQQALITTLTERITALEGAK